MENGCLEGVLVVKALYDLRSISRCFSYSFHSCCSLGWEAIFMSVFLLLQASWFRVLWEKQGDYRAYKLM
jgi:hypothetical protein